MLLPTTTLSAGEVIQTDVLGRVRVSRARREALLDEFERGGASGQAFAVMVGIKYPTFATWVQGRRRARGEYAPTTATSPRALPLAAASPAALRLVEAVVALGPTTPPGPTAAAEEEVARVRIILPGGAHAELRNAAQAPLLAALLRALAHDPRPC